MAIKFIPVKCPECGAALNVEEGRKQIFCSYCGTKILIHNENEYIYHRIDEADIKQAETEAMLRLKEMELEEKENKRMHRRRLLAYVVAAAFVLFGALIVPKNEFGGSMAIFVGIIIAGSDFALGMDTKKKHHVITENEAMISAKMRDYCGKSYRSITALYRAAGFTNVSAVPMCDLKETETKKNGQVEEVTVNGISDFEEGDVFPKTAMVTVAYHSYQK